MAVLSAADLLARLPERTRSHLQALLRALTEGLGPDLVAVLAHGSAVRGGYREDVSDVDLMVVLRRDEPDALKLMANPLILARAAARIEAMILRQDELESSADVFPLLFRDIQRHHAVLHGVDPLRGVQVHDHHLRLRIEQELRDAQIRLRRLMVDEGGDATHMVGPMERKVKQMRSPLHALMQLQGRDCADDLQSVLRGAGQALSVDTTPLFHIREQPEAALKVLRSLLTAAVKAADGHGAEAR